jgi:hypothetical protein
MANLEYKMGLLEGRMKAVEADLEEIKKSTGEISDALTKGKGVFIGLLIAASSAGAFLSEFIKKLMN